MLSCYNKPMLTFLPIVIAGWAAGILVNYLADVLPCKRKLAAPFCFHCGRPMSTFNYLIWPRRCPNCNKLRPFRTWLIEALYIIGALWLWLSPPARLGFIVSLILLIYFGVVVVIDIEHRLILHVVSLFGAVLGLIVGTWVHGLTLTLIGGLAGFGAMLALYYLGIIFVRILAPRRGGSVGDEALGFGDVMLSGVLGLMLGWPAILAGLFFTIILAGIFSFLYLIVMLLGRRYHISMAIPYGPFLVSSAFLLIFFSSSLANLFSR